MNTLWSVTFGNPRVDITTSFTVNAKSERAARAEAARLRTYYKIPERLSSVKPIGPAILDRAEQLAVEAAP